MIAPTNKPQALSDKARGGIPLAPQGWTFIIGTLLLLLISTPLSWTVMAVILAILFAFVVIFFFVILNVKYHRVMTYILPLPMAEEITSIKYTGGKFVNTSIENERKRFEMEADNGMKIAFTQIYNLIARHIILYVSVGNKVSSATTILTRKIES